VSLNAYLNSQRVTKSAEEFQTSLDRLSTIVLTLKADAGFLIDTGQRKSFWSMKKAAHPKRPALLMVANLVSLTRKSGTIGVPVNVSSALERLAEPRGLAVKRLRTLRATSWKRAVKKE